MGVSGAQPSAPCRRRARAWCGRAESGRCRRWRRRGGCRGACRPRGGRGGRCGRAVIGRRGVPVGLRFHGSGYATVGSRYRRSSGGTLYRQRVRGLRALGGTKKPRTSRPGESGGNERTHVGNRLSNAFGTRSQHLDYMPSAMGHHAYQQGDLATFKQAMLLHVITSADSQSPQAPPSSPASPPHSPPHSRAHSHPQAQACSVPCPSSAAQPPRPRARHRCSAP